MTEVYRVIYLEQVKAKVRDTESNMNTKEESFFAALSRGTREATNKRRKTVHPEIDIRQYFTDTAIRDNILAIICPLLSEWEITRILCSSKSAFNCNVSFEEARLNLDLLSGRSVKDCKKYVAGVSNEMLDQFEPWYFGVAFALF